MNIEKYRIDKDLYEIRDSIKSKYEVLVTLSEEIRKHTKPIVENKAKEFYDSFKEFFKANGFEISKAEIGNGTMAYNEKSKFELEIIDLESTEAKFAFKMRSENIYEFVLVKGTEDTKKLIGWKSNSGLSNFMLDEFAIQPDTTAEKLEKIETAVDENIQWYRNTLTEIDKLEFVFCSEYGKVYKDFKDYFEKI